MNVLNVIFPAALPLRWRPSCKDAPSIYVAMDLHILLIRAQNTVDFPIGGHVNVLSDYKETGPDNLF